MSTSPHSVAVRRNRVPASAVYNLLGFTTEQAFNHARRRLQQVLNETLHRFEPYPDLAGTHFPTEQALVTELEVAFHDLDRQCTPERRAELRAALAARRSDLSRLVRPLEVAFERTHTLVVPRWGGIKYPSSAWTYDLALCEALSVGGSTALLQAGSRGREGVASLARRSGASG